MNENLKDGIDIGGLELEIPYLQYEILGAPAQEWLFAVLITIAGTALLVVLGKFIAGRVNWLAKRTKSDIGHAIASLIRGMRTWFWFVIALFVAIALVELPALVETFVGFFTFIVVLLQIGLWGNGLINYGIQKYREKRLEQDAASVTTVNALGFIGRLFLWSVIFLVALDTFGVDVTAMVASLGVVGIAVGLALQGILGDLFGSLSIVMDKPFVIGDFLNVDNYLGTVEYIGLKSTRVRSLSGEQIIFSNSDLLKSRIRNYKRMLERRIVFGLGVVYQTPYDKLAAIPAMLRQIVESHEPVRFDRAHFKEYGAYSLNFEIVYYVLSPDFGVYMDIQQSINLTIYRRFEEEGIVFAFPTQSLYFETQPMPVRTENNEVN